MLSIQVLAIVGAYAGGFVWRDEADAGKLVGAFLGAVIGSRLGWSVGKGCRGYLLTLVIAVALSLVGQCLYDFALMNLLARPDFRY